MNDLARRSVAAVMWNFGGALGRALAQVFIQIALARVLGPQVFGQYAVVLAVLGIGWLIVDSGFGAALIQKTQIDEKDVGYALGWVLIAGLMIGGSISLSAKWLALLFNEPNLVAVFQVTGFLVLLQALSNIPTSLMRRELDAKRLQVIQLLSYIIGFGVIGITLAIMGGGIWSLVISFLSQILISLCGFYGCVRHTLRPRWSGDVSFRHFGLQVLGTNLANWAIENLDRIVVGKIWGMPSLGAYSVTLNLSRAPVGMLVGSMQSVVFASAAKIKEDSARLRRGYLAMIGGAMLLMLPLFSLLAMASDSVISIVYGDRWHEAAPLFCAFSMSMPLYIVTALTGPLLWSMGRVNKELNIQLFVLVVMMIGFWLVSGFALSVAIWLIPLIFLLRAILTVSALAAQIKISLWDICQAIRGGVILSGLTIGTWLIVVQLEADDYILPGLAIDMEFIRMQIGPGYQLLNNIVRLAICTFICASFTYMSRGWLLGKETRALLLNIKHDSGIARLILKITGLQ